MAFSESLKLSICKSVTEKQMSVADAALKANCSPSTIYSWLSAYVHAKECSTTAESLIPSNLSMLEAIALASLCEHYGWDSEQAGIECRKRGVKVSELTQFFDACKAEGVESAKSNRSLKREISHLKKQMSGLERDQGRLEKALAETTTCLVELKKVQAFFNLAED